MEISEKHQQEINQIIAGIECPKDFACCQSGFEEMCKVKDIGLEDYFECSEEVTKLPLCTFSLSYGYSYLCRCPLRIYLARNLRI
jgi:hypothetical protein